MKRLVLVTAFAALAACSQQAAPPAEDANLAVENEVAAAPAPSLNETSWEFTQDGKAMQESIDANGNYVTTSGNEVVDHGVAVVKDGKSCFTSAVRKDGEECWADPALEIGASGETVSDKGKKLTIKRVAYIPRTK